MKTVTSIMILLFSFNVHAACKCNCNPTDRKICASSYDLDRPCTSICPGQGQTAAGNTSIGYAPMITACPGRIVVNELTGAHEWSSDCDKY